MELVLKVKDLYKSYGEDTIINGISFEIEEGEIVGFIGENGSGKTTTLSMIAGIKKITQGDIFVCGHSISDGTVDYHKKMAVVFDERPFYPQLSGEANLFQNTHSAQDVARVLKLCGLYDARKKQVGKYSLGMKQRLNIARAFLKNPKLMLMDEPFNGLDPKALAEFKTNVRNEIVEQNSTLLISSHALKELLFFCNRYIFIKSGTIFADVKSNNQNIEKENAYIDLSSAADFEKVKAVLGENATFIESINRVYFANSDNTSDVCGFAVKMLNPGETVLENIYLSMS